jgi:hypothetical protein
VESMIRNSFKLPSRSEVATQLIAFYQSFAANCLFDRAPLTLSKFIKHLSTAISFSFESIF